MRTLSIVILIFVCQLMPVSTYADPQELPELLDLAQLNLEVIHTEITDEISYAMNKLSSTKDENVVSVTLKGSIKSSCKLRVEARSFIALFETESMKEDFGKQWKFSDAVSTGNTGGWAIFIKEKGMISAIHEDVISPGSVIIRVAFLLPKGVNSFSVLYPTLAKGKATLSIQDSKKSQK